MFIPLSDEDSQPEFTPRITLLLLTINGAVFFYEMGILALGGIHWMLFLVTWGLIPALLTQAPDLHSLATVITHMFIHGGWAHFVFNMLFLWVFGYAVEQHLGGTAFSLFYLISGIVAGLCHVALNADNPVPMIGASGAISGVMGAFIVKYPRSRIKLLMAFFPMKMPAFLYLGIWFLFDLIDGYRLEVMGDESLRGTAYMAHIGGFLIGALLMAIFRVVENE